MGSVRAFQFSLWQQILITLMMIGLASCSSRVSRPDGPPHFYVDETRIQNAIPKKEPLAKYGNMPFYHVFGKRYYVMKTWKYYDQVGTASWYGTKFHARRTSSGEPYNLLAMTAAHKTLPLPTYVEVTNLANNRKVIVKVNDRGPFVGNRLIDLSYVAAKKLGMLGHGTANVRVRAIDPSSYGRTPLFASAKPYRMRKPVTFAPVADVKSSNHSAVYLQVGAFRNKSNALKLQAQLLALSMPVKIAYPSAKANLYRVQVGPLRDLVTVNRLTNKLKMLGIKSNKLAGA